MKKFKIIYPGKDGDYDILADINSKELKLLTEWYNAVEDLNPRYLCDEDTVLITKIKKILEETS